MPQMAEKAGKFLRISFADWNSVDTPLFDHPIEAYEPLAMRLDPKVVAQLIEPDAAEHAPRQTRRRRPKNVTTHCRSPRRCQPRIPAS